MSTPEWRKREKARKDAMVISIARHAVARLMRSRWIPRRVRGELFLKEVEIHIDGALSVAYTDAEFHGVSKRAVKQQFLEEVKKQIEDMLAQKGLRNK